MYTKRMAQHSNAKRTHRLIIFSIVLISVLLIIGLVWRQKYIVEETGAITGYVSLGSTCPVERTPPLARCADKPYAAGLELVLEGWGGIVTDHPTVVKEFSSGTDGKFTLKVAPGDYEIHSPTSPDDQTTASLPSCGWTQMFTVKANETVHVTVSCDTGIR